MNYLAHIYLSYNTKNIQIGNFIADSVKGNDYLHYPKDIEKGILIHRNIDTYTDNHLIVKECKKVFSSYRHYAGVITDIIFDHFLAKNWNRYHHEELTLFTRTFYTTLETNFEILPKRVQSFFDTMKKENWLTQYATIGGISDILFQMNLRTSNISKMNYSVIELRENYTFLETQFGLFFEDLEDFVKTTYPELTLIPK